MSWESAYRAACTEEGIEMRSDLRTGGAAGDIIFHGNTLPHFTERLRDADAAALARAIRSCRTVSTLCLPYNAITDVGGVLLCEALSHHLDHLRTVDLRYSELGPEAGIALAKALQPSKTLSTLILAGNPLGGRCGGALQALVASSTSLTVLDVHSTEMDAYALTQLCMALASNRHLVSLDLSRPLLTSPAEVAKVVTSLAEALRRHAALEVLRLDYFGLGDEDLHRLVRALDASTVTSLHLRGNQFSAGAGADLSRLLTRRTDLRELNLGFNRLRGSGATALSQGLRRHPQLEALALEGCAMEESGLVDLVMALRSCTALHHLSLWGNEMTPSVALAMSRAFGGLHQFDYTDFGIEQREGQWTVYRNTSRR